MNLKNDKFREPEHQEDGYNLPEFVDMSEEFEEAQYEHHTFEGIPKQTEIDVPFYVRFISLFCCVGVIVLALINLLLAILFGVLNLVTLFKNERLCELMKGFWKKVCRNIVIALGLFIAFFNPQLGLVLIVSYFMLKDEQWQQGVMGEMLNSQFSQYYKF